VSFPDLRAFIDQLRRDGDVVTVDARVDPKLEVAEIHRRVIAAGGPALLFTNVAGSPFRLVTNLFGTARRAELAFGERPLRLIKRLVHLAETILPPTPSALWGARDVGLELLKVGLKRVPAAPVTERMVPAALDQLPALVARRTAIVRFLNSTTNAYFAADDDPLYGELHAIEERVEAAVPTTREGAIAQLQYLLDFSEEGFDFDERLWKMVM